jgi:hypothetical protein
MPNGIKGRIPKITRLLQDVEDHLENEDAAASSSSALYAKKIIFSPTADSISKIQSFDDSFNSSGAGDGDRQGTMRSLLEGDLPVLEGTPSGKQVLKVYMNNQLELQQSEWESYEAAFDSLDRELQSVTIERDSLREELAEQNSVSEDLLIKFKELESDYEQLSEVLTLHPPSLRSHPTTATAPPSSLHLVPPNRDLKKKIFH